MTRATGLDLGQGGRPRLGAARLANQVRVALARRLVNLESPVCWQQKSCRFYDNVLYTCFIFIFWVSVRSL